MCMSDKLLTAVLYRGSMRASMNLFRNELNIITEQET